jgi:nucleotide-binding universal stress UspA family protein
VWTHVKHATPSIAELNQISKMIIVGYDGSEVSDLAVQWAAHSPSSRHLLLNVIVAWSAPPPEVGIRAGPAYETHLLNALRNEATKIMDKGVNLALETATEMKVSGYIYAGAPAGVLVESAQDAEMVVLGSHGRSGCIGLTLGIVSRKVTGRANCPAVVVRRASDSAAREIGVGVDDSAEVSRHHRSR